MIYHNGYFFSLRELLRITIFRNRDGESKCDKCGMECCSAAHLNLLHNRRPADAFVGGKKALEMLRLVLLIAVLFLIVDNSHPVIIAKNLHNPFMK